MRSMFAGRRKLIALVLIATGLFTTGLVIAQSGWPGNPGDDPWDTRPNDPNYNKFWALFSHLPPDHVGEIRPYEQGWGSGLHVDKAWQLHTGRPDTVVAVLDSGIYWDASDLATQHWVNVGELPLPVNSQVHDKNADGRVNGFDYVGDPRVSDVNQDGRIDPGDLIAAFSDGIDSDGNGYIDDISGWDFHELDNDPADRTRFGHGTGEAKDSTAATNNGNGGVGICSGCSIMSIRLNDSFIVDANAFATAVRFAVDSGATVIQQALGSFNWSPAVVEAIEYAYDNNVPIIGSAADENSFHHNYPSTIDPVIYANAIRHDTRRSKDATTFLNFNNCSNFGARVDVSVPGIACSSEATGNLSGVTALALSYAKLLGRPLTAGQVTSLIQQSARDINRGEARRDSDRHSTFAGWDVMSGYGRADAFAMLTRIKDERVPPVARIVSPQWFTVWDGKDRLSITMETAAGSRKAVEARLEVLRGVESSGREWRFLAAWDAANSSINSIDYSLDPAQLAGLEAGSQDAERNHQAFTLRLTVTDARGESSESRRTIFVIDDERLVLGAAQFVSGSGESGGLFADLDGDGRDEYVTATGAGELYVYGAEGLMPGFPVGLGDSQYLSGGQAAVFAPLAVGQVAGDERLEIVALSAEGHLTVVDASGQVLAGFPQRVADPDWNIVRKEQVLAGGFYASPALADFDGDSRHEIVAVSLAGELHVWSGNGEYYQGYPVDVVVGERRAKVVSSPAIADLNEDGVPDMVFGTNHQGDESGTIIAIDGRGQLAPSLVVNGFPMRIPVIKDAILPTIGTGVPAAPAIGNFDRDSDLEILVHAFVGKSYLVTFDGAIKRILSSSFDAKAGVAQDLMLSAFGQPAGADVNGDGVLDPIGVGVGREMLTALLLGGKRVQFDHLKSAWDGSTGQMLEGWPQRLDDMALAPSLLALDGDADGKLELLGTSGGYYVRGLAGQAPFFTGGWSYGTPSLGDLDGDGRYELGVTTREGYVFLWHTGVAKSDRAVTHFKGGPLRQGRF